MSVVSRIVGPRSGAAARDIRRRLAAVALLVGAFPHGLWGQAPLAGGEEISIRERVGSVALGTGAAVAGRRLESTGLLDRFYARNDYKAVWVGPSGILSPHGLALVGLLGEAQDHGLDPKDYHLPAISARIAAGGAGDAGADLELLLTDGALNLAGHLSSGKVKPERLYDGWRARPREPDIVSVLWRSLEGDVRSFGRAFRQLAPQDPRYAKLKTLLLALRNDVDRPLPRVPQTLLRMGDRGPAVAAVSRRLAAWDGRQAPSTEVDFDIELEDRVKEFQLRHGLQPDGVVGSKTIDWLNRPYAERIRQVRVNLERWRWMPGDLGRRRIEVNIAGFRVDVMESDHAVLSMRAIVGKPYHKTPVFSDRMTYLVLNPSWNVPWSIAVNEILPQLRRDPAYLSDKNMRVLSGWGNDARVVDVSAIDWNAFTRRNFRYRFQQMPGEDNALGRVKFMFPNEFNVYLHDTPARSLFESESRGFSHGCVRLEKPMELAHYLLKGDGQWSPERVLQVLSSGRETQVPIPGSLPVHIMYWTVWVDDAGRPHFRTDIYRRDEPLAAALIDEQE